MGCRPPGSRCEARCAARRCVPSRVHARALYGSTLVSRVFKVQPWPCSDPWPTTCCAAAACAALLRGQTAAETTFGPGGNYRTVLLGGGGGNHGSKWKNNGRKRRAGTLPLVPPRASAGATRSRTGKGHQDHGEEGHDVRAIYFCFARRQVACLPRRLPPRLGLGAGRGGLCLRGGRVPVLPDPVPRPPGPAPPRNPLI